MLRYRVDTKPGGFTRAELQANGDGGADALVIIPIMRGELEGDSRPSSYGIVTADSDSEGKDAVAELRPVEVFGAMIALASFLGQHPEVPEWQRMVSRKVVDSTREFLGIEITARESVNKKPAEEDVK